MPAVLTKKQEAKRASTRLAVDFPKQNEIINSPQYTLRLCAPEGVKSVEVALDDGEWQPCRQAVGYWWFDWSGFGDGEHEVIARIELEDGRKIASEPHEFFVDLQPKPKA